MLSLRAMLNTPINTPPAASDDGVESCDTESSKNTFVATDSPCVAICSTLFDEICRGCGRTDMEVCNWVIMDEEEKRVVWLRIKAQGYPRRRS